MSCAPNLPEKTTQAQAWAEWAARSRQPSTAPLTESGRACQQALALAGVLRERGGAQEIGARLGVPPELRQQIGARGREQVIPRERRLGGERVEDGEARRGALGAGDGDGAVELDDGRGHQAGELSV